MLGKKTEKKKEKKVDGHPQLDLITRLQERTCKCDDMRSDVHPYTNSGANMVM